MRHYLIPITAVVLAMLALMFIDELPGKKPVSMLTHPEYYECGMRDVQTGVCTQYDLKEEFKR